MEEVQEFSVAKATKKTATKKTATKKTATKKTATKKTATKKTATKKTAAGKKTITKKADSKTSNKVVKVSASIEQMDEDAGLEKIDDKTSECFEASLSAKSDECALVESKKPNKLVNQESLIIKISDSLRLKLKSQAEDEGVSLEEFVTELLAEGAVIRAWEIIEKKSTMTGGQNHQGNKKEKNFQSKGGYKQQGNFKRGNKRNSNSNGNSKKNNYNHIMDDNANFMEYLRSQENRNR